MEKVKIEKVVHKGWKELQGAEAAGIPPIFGKYQYIYSSSKGKISLIELINYYRDGKDLWEIHSIGKEGLFEDTEKFETKEEAEEKIMSYLN